jgi:hypothetical protein
MVAYGGLQVKLHAFMNCALGGGEGRLFVHGTSDLHCPLDRVLDEFQSVFEDCVEGNVCLCGESNPDYIAVKPAARWS